MKKQECPFMIKGFCRKTLPRVVNCILKGTPIDFNICKLLTEGD